MTKLFAFIINGSMFYATSSVSRSQYKLIDTLANNLLALEVNMKLNDDDIFSTFIEQIYNNYQIKFYPCNIENIFRLNNKV